MLGKLWGPRPIRNRVLFLSMIEEKPVFEFQGDNPPDWLMKAMRDKVVGCHDGALHIGGKEYRPGSVIHRKAVA